MKNIEENNKLIAEFMGAKFRIFPPTEHYIGETILENRDEMPSIYNSCRVESFKHHTSWDWLMPVVEKMENSSAKITIGRMFCEIEYKDLFDKDKQFEIKIVSGVKINAVNGAVVEFIKWYNENKND